MAFDHNVGGHAFTERGGKCVKCGITWAAYEDKDSKNFQRRCAGQKPEQQERMTIED